MKENVKDKARILLVEDLKRDLLEGLEQLDQGQSAPFDVNEIKALARQRLR